LAAAPAEKDLPALVSHNLRKYASQTRTRLILGLISLAFLVGDGLIYLFMGRGPALMGLACLLVALVPAGIVWLILAILDWTVRRANRD
jgi:hypothetical protein